MPRTIALVALALFVSACNGEDGDTDDTDAGPDLEAALADLTAAMDGYETWNQSANWQGIQPSVPGNHEAPYAQIWWNQAAYDTLVAAEGGDMPVGAVSAKVNYQDEEGTSPTYLFGMQKTDDGWFFALYEADGSDVVLYSFEDGVSNCYNCHLEGQDFVMAEEF